MNRSNVVMITGGCGRIGYEVVLKVLSGGGRAAVVDIDIGRCLDLVERFDGSVLEVIEADVTQPRVLAKAISTIVAKFGSIDVLVHAAYPRSPQWGQSLEQLDPDSLKTDLFMQLGGTILTCQQVALQMQDVGRGNIILLSSIQGIAAPKFHHYEGTRMTSPIEYSAIKAGVIGVTKWLAKYLQADGIRVNCVSPGGVFDDQPQRFVDQYRKSCGNKGLLDPLDVVGPIMFLASDASSYMTGQNIVVDDGWSL